MLNSKTGGLLTARKYNFVSIEALTPLPEKRTLHFQLITITAASKDGNLHDLTTVYVVHIYSHIQSYMKRISTLQVTKKCSLTDFEKLKKTIKFFCNFIFFNISERALYF